MSEITEAANRLEKALDPAKRNGWSRLHGYYASDLGPDDESHSEIEDLRAVLAAVRSA